MKASTTLLIAAIAIALTLTTSAYLNVNAWFPAAMCAILIVDIIGLWAAGRNEARNAH